MQFLYSKLFHKIKGYFKSYKKKKDFKTEIKIFKNG